MKIKQNEIYEKNNLVKSLAKLQLYTIYMMKLFAHIYLYMCVSYNWPIGSIGGLNFLEETDGNPRGNFKPKNRFFSKLNFFPRVTPGISASGKYFPAK